MPGKSVEPAKAGGLATLRADVMAIPEDVGTEDVSDLIVARILANETLEDSLNPTTAPSMGDLAGIPIIVHDARRREGGQNKATGFYLLLDVENTSTGERSIYSTGATNIVTQVTLWYKRGWLPVACQVWQVESKTNPGQFIHWLTQADRAPDF